MSSTIDNRIVSMAFDNKQFESDASQTMGTLAKLKESLNFSGAGKGLEDLQNAGNRANFNPMAAAIDGLSAKFVLMSTIAITAISNVVSRAVDAGISIGKALSLDQITSGFQEYETNINSIQTILANTKADGTNLEDVNNALINLNHYADQTIYNFSEMARNIGTFTAAGVDLSTATDAIKGIANLAAISGSNSQQAATAMYQLSQAIASGSVKLMDWNSVVNAGMGGEVFQRALYDTGLALGTITNVPIGTTFEEWNKKTGSFRNTLSEAQQAGEKLAESQTQAGKLIKDAQDSAAESIANANKRIVDAQKSVSDATKQAAEDMADAVKAETKAQEDGAASIAKAFDDVIAARDRLNEALQPASEDDLQAANDRLRLSQLNQADNLDALTAARNKQQAATNALATAQARLSNLQSIGAPSNQISQAQSQVAAAQKNLDDLTEAFERAQISQNSATRDIKKAEKELAAIKDKGSEKDKAVIDARQNLLDAEKRFSDTQVQAQENIEKATERVAKVAETSAERRRNAIESLNEAERNAAKVSEKAQESIANAHKQADDIIKAATGANAEPPGWVTSDVLTTALKVFSGDLTDAELKAAGFTDEQVGRMKELGKLGKDSATQVKTLTQLYGTLKESVGSGWAQTFGIIFGDFEEARGLFTDLSNRFGTITQNSGNARNQVLTDWKKAGGRDTLIDALNNSMELLGDLIKPLKDAFRNVFPPQTGETLAKMTKNFNNFIKNLQPSQETITQLTRIFTGLFSILDIGWTVLKEGVKTVATFFDSLAGDGRANGALEFFASLGDKISEFHGKVVTVGGIADFFENVRKSIKKFFDETEAFKSIGDFFDTVGDKLEQFMGKVKGFFSDDTSNKTNKINDALDQLRDRFGWVSKDTDTISSKWDRFAESVGKLKDSFNDFTSTIRDKLKDAWDNIIKVADFGPSLDLVNTGLLGGILIIIKKFTDAVLHMDFGNGLITKIGDTLDTFREKLKAMTFDIKANALLKIAASIAILALSLLLISSIDTLALIRATTALAAVTAVMVTAFTKLAKISGGSIKLPVLANSIIGFAFAVSVLAKAVVNIGKIDFGDMIKGLLGVTILMDLVVSAAKPLSKLSGGMISAGIGMIGIAIAIGILGVSVKFFSTLDWEELGKGLLGVAGALGAVVAAVKIMEADKGGIFAAGVGVAAMAFGLLLLAGAVKIFGSMDWAEMGKGLLGLAGVLAAIVIFMPPTLPKTGLGLLLVAGALVIIATAMQIFGTMDWEEIAKGLVAIGGSLLILTIAALAMEEAIPGALAMVIMAGALLVLSKVMVTLGKLSWGTIIKAIVGMALGILVLAAAAVGLAIVSVLLSEAVPFILAFGVALLVVGAAMALFGIGLYLVVAAIENLVDLGGKGVSTFGDMLEEVAKKIPDIIAAFVTGLIDGAVQILDRSNELVDKIIIFAGKILDGLVTLTPKLGELIGALIDEFLKFLDEHGEEIIDAGWTLFKNLLQGISDHIEDIVHTVGDILTKFFTAIGDKAEDVIHAGALMLASLLKGITDNLETVTTAMGELSDKFFEEIGKLGVKFIDSGTSLVILLATSMTLSAYKLVTAGVTLFLAFLDGLLDNTVRLVNGVFQLVTDFLNTMADVVRERGSELRAAGKNLLSAILEGVVGISKEDQQRVKDALVNLFKGGVKAVWDFLEINSPSKVFMRIAQSTIEGFTLGIDKDGSAISDSLVGMGSSAVGALRECLSTAYADVLDKTNLKPQIKPVMDFTQIQKDTKTLAGLVSDSSSLVVGSISFDQASIISDSTNAQKASEISAAQTEPITRDVTLIQNNNSPKALSTGEIYRGTKSLLNVTKGELGIP